MPMNGSSIIMDAPPAYSETVRSYPGNAYWPSASYSQPQSHNMVPSSQRSQQQRHTRQLSYSPAPSYHSVDASRYMAAKAPAKADIERSLADSLSRRASSDASDPYASKKAGLQQRGTKPLHGPRSPPVPQYTPGYATNAPRPHLHLQTSQNSAATLDSPVIHPFLSPENNISWDADRVNLLPLTSPSQEAIDWESVEKTMVKSAYNVSKHHDPSESFLCVSDNEDFY